MLKKALLNLLIIVPCFAQMSLEEKVGQLLIVHFNGESVTEEAKSLIQEQHVGGFIYYNWSNGLHSPEQVKHLSSELQALSPIPLFIAVDQEGGRVTRLIHGFTQSPGNHAIAMTGRDSYAEEIACLVGRELKDVGINLNLAPVVDINNNPRNPIIGTRSFGETPEIVIRFAKHALQGYRKSGVLSCLKHYPGHGDVEIDSHHGLPIINKSISELWEMELLPFSQLAHDAAMIMTAHICMPALDANKCATLSKPILALLRDEIGFEGVIISDSLIMEGILKQCPSIDEAAICAFNAGCDLLLLGGKLLHGTHADLELTPQDIRRIHQSLVDAVKKGSISQERLENALNRILSLKSSF